MRTITGPNEKSWFTLLFSANRSPTAIGQYHSGEAVWSWSKQPLPHINVSDLLLERLTQLTILQSNYNLRIFA